MIKIIDFETQNHPWYGQVASMHNPENFVVEAGWLDINWGEPLLQANVRSHRSDTLEESRDTSWFSLDGTEILVAHNAGYEIHVLLQRYREEFLKFLKRGGRVLCTQYAEYLLTDFQHQYASLEEIAPNYGGTQKVDGIKILWEQGHLTADIDKQLLHDYLTGEEGDIMNTAKVFFGQVQKLQEREQWPMFLERCESLLAFAFAEDAGLKVDQEVAERNLQELIEDSEAIRKELEQYVPEDMPPELEFDWSNRWMVSALLFGGARPYTVRGPYEPKKYVKADYYRIEGEKEEYIRVDSYNELCLETFGELPQLVTYTRGKNVGQPKVFRLDTTEEKLKNYELTYNFPGLIKIDELPEHLQENFRTGGEWCGSQQQRCGTPVYSTTAEVMEVIAAHGFEAAIKLVELNRFQKEQGTFYIRHEYDTKGEVKKTSGALQYVQPDGIIHHRLNMCATVTGRLSASSPSMQNLPRADEDDDGAVKSKVKEMYVSRFEGGHIAQVDFTALEVVMQAALTGDTELLAQLQAGTDMHCYRLAPTLGLTYEETRAIYKDSSHPDHYKVARLRTAIKPRAFAAQYGASAMGIAYATGCTVEEAQEFLDNEAELFPISIGYRDIVRAEVERTGMQAGNLHREMQPDGTWGLYRRGYFRTPGGTRYSFRQYLRWCSVQRKRVMDYKDTQLANYWCQGEAFFVMAVAAGLVIRWLINNDFLGGKAYLINNVHDALYLDCHPDVTKQVAEKVKELMEYAPKHMSYLGYDIADVPFPAVPVWGHNMLQEFSLDELE